MQRQLAVVAAHFDLAEVLLVVQKLLQRPRD